MEKVVFAELALKLLRDQKRGAMTPNKLVDELQKLRTALDLGEGWK